MIIRRQFIDIEYLYTAKMNRKEEKKEKKTFGKHISRSRPYCRRKHQRKSKKPYLPNDINNKNVNTYDFKSIFFFSLACSYFPSRHLSFSIAMFPLIYLNAQKSSFRLPFLSLFLSLSDRLYQKKKSDS